MAVEKQVNIRVTETGLDELNADLKSLDKNLDKVDDSSGKAAKGVEDVASNGGAIAILDSFTGGLATSFRDAFEATKLFNFSLKGTRKALIATGIGAMVVALGLVVAYWDDITDYIKGVNKELEAQLKLTQEINTELERRAFINKLDLEAQKSREEQEILKAKIAGASEEDITEIKRQGFIDRIAIAQAEADESQRILNESVSADEETYKKAIKAQEDAFKNLGIQRGALSIFDLEQQLPDNNNTTTDKRDKVSGVGGSQTAEEQQAIREQQASFFEEQLGLTQYRADALAQIQIDADESISNNARLQAAAREEISEKETDAKLSAFQTYAATLSVISGAIGQNTKEGKALAIASSLINTYSSIAGQLAAFSGVPVPGFAIAQAIATGVAGFAAVKNIAKVKVPGQGGGGASIPSGSGGGGGGVQAPQFNTVGVSGVNQLADSINNDNAPVQAFVVGSNVTTQQAADRNIVDTATIG